MPRDGAVALAGRGDLLAVRHDQVMRRRARPPAPISEFAGFRFPPEVIVLAVRRYLRYALSHRDVEEHLAERCIVVDHVTLFRWVRRFTPLLIDAPGRVVTARATDGSPTRHRGTNCTRPTCRCHVSGRLNAIVPTMVT